MGRIGCGWVSAAWVLAFASVTPAEDVFMTIGGGPTPTSNQVSLEKNVHFLQRTLARVRPDEPRHEIFFADGTQSQRDLQYRDPDAEVSAAVQWMSRLFDNESATTMRYRDHEIRPVAGPTRKAWLKQAIGELSNRLGEGDRLILYVTAHGGSAETFDFDYGYGQTSTGTNEFDTTIALWNDESLTVSELTDWLNRMAPGVKVTMIMAQCYAGGFSHAIFHDGDADHGLNPRPRCGFFSQQHDRVAAGCTPEIEEADYQEYSTYFWAALGGSGRTGQPIEGVDYDGDGRVSFAEAHAYAVITSETLDIPVRTSGALLRQFSKISKATKEESDSDVDTSLGKAVGALFGGASPDDLEPSSAGGQDGSMWTWQTPIATVIELARPDQRAIITALAETLEIPTDQPIRRVRGKFRRVGRKLEERVEAQQTAYADRELNREKLLKLVQREWPEWSSEGYTPIISELTSTRSEEFLSFVTAQPESDAMRKADERLEEGGEEISRLQIREAKLGRLLRTLQNVLLEQNLASVASPETVAYFERLMAMEEETLQTERP